MQGGDDSHVINESSINMGVSKIWVKGANYSTDLASRLLDEPTREVPSGPTQRVAMYMSFPSPPVQQNAFFLRNILEEENAAEYLFSERFSGNLWQGRGAHLLGVYV